MITVQTLGDGSLYASALGREAHTAEAPSEVESGFELSDIMTIPFAVWQPRTGTVEDFQLRPEVSHELERALANAQTQPRPLSTPRRIFLSYRWGNPSGSSDDDSWVEALQAELERRGNQVVFDHEAQGEANPPTVEEMVARIAGCHMFLAVLDPGYVERLAIGADGEVQEGWVTDEFFIALAFAERSMLTLLGLWRSGDSLPSAFRPFSTGEAGNTFDVRDDGSLEPVLDQFFVQFGDVPDDASATAAAMSLHRSKLALDAGKGSEALDHAKEACELVPGIPDGLSQRCRVAYDLHRFDVALSDAQRALEIDPTRYEMLIYAAAASNDLGQWHLGAQQARSAMERNRADANARYLLARALGELGQLDSAMAHFELARDAGLKLVRFFGHAGVTWQQAGDPATALDWYTQGLALQPDDLPCLANGTAAAIEAGFGIRAFELLEALAERHPYFQQLGALTSALRQWAQSDDPPPILIERQARPTPAAVATCSRCAARVSLAEDEPLMCQGCGAPAESPERACACCGSDGWIIPGQEMFACPFCRQGSLTLQPV